MDILWTIVEYTAAVGAVILICVFTWAASALIITKTGNWRHNRRRALVAADARLWAALRQEGAEWPQRKGK